MTETTPFRIGLLLFPRLTQLDLTGPFEVFARMPGAEIHLLWKTLDPVPSDNGLRLLPTTPLESAPSLDLVCVPGGAGIADLLQDDDVLGFLHRTAATARFVTSVCTGSLVLGAAGLLKGKRATCHWLSLPLLAAFGAEPVAERTVRDGTLITGGGVTAGLDFALSVVAEVRGRAAAEAIQLGIEYDPQPPFAAGSPHRADPALVAAVRDRTAARQRERRDLVAAAAARLLPD